MNLAFKRRKRLKKNYIQKKIIRFSTLRQKVSEDVRNVG